MNEHRVPMLGAALRRHVDPARSTDPKVRELVAALATLEVGPAPRPEFRAELRAQLVAVTPRLVAEGEPPAAPAKTNRVEQAEPAERRRFRILKPLVAVACVLTAFVLLLGGAVLISQHALPGDALYGIKRASEATEYSLTGGDVAKGKLKLEFAARRIGEVADLLPQASSMAAGAGALADGAISSQTAGLVRDTLGSADSDVRAAAQMLGSNAVRNDDAGPLAAINSWTPDQITAMQQIVASIPAGALHQRAGQTLALLRAAQTRARLLHNQLELGCTCLDSSRSDQLGPLPCTGPCTQRSVGPSPQPTPSTRPAGTGAPKSSGGSTPAPGASTRTNAPGVTNSSGPATKTKHPGSHPSSSAGSLSSTSPSAPSASPSLPIPTLPGLGGSTGGTTGGTTGAPHPPVSVTTSCASLGIGPIGIGIGNC
ncbi:MAG TPA: DUF5667 domain-containing protein [Jatrophihabitans sp.]|jgi:hypothetical protein